MKFIKILFLATIILTNLAGSSVYASDEFDDTQKEITREELLERIRQLEFKMCVKDVEDLEKQLDEGDGFFHPYLRIWIKNPRPWDDLEDIKDKLQACTELKEELEQQVSARCFDFVFCDDREEFEVPFPEDFEEIKEQTGVIVD